MKTQVYDSELCGYMNYLLSEEKSPATCEKYMRDIRSFYRFSGGRELCKALIIEYKNWCIEAGYAPRSVNSMLASINSYLGYIDRQDCKVKSIRLQRKMYCQDEQELSKQEYRRLLKSAGNRQIRIILQTICATGIRVSELKYFTLESVQTGHVTIRCKGKTRTILIPGKLRTLLLSYAKKHSLCTGPIFLGRKGQPMDRSCIWRQMKALCAAAGVAAGKVFPHNLRKLFARTFYEAERDIAGLADLLGHSNINTTRIYIISTGYEHRRRIERLDLL